MSENEQLTWRKIGDTSQQNWSEVGVQGRIASELLNRKNCTKLPAVWITPCCWVVILLRGGINFFFNEAIMKIIITLTRTWSGWSWKRLDSPQLALYSSFMGILRFYSPVQHTSSSGKQHAPFCLCRVPCGLVAEAYTEVAKSATLQRSAATGPGSSSWAPVGRGVPRALGSCGLKPGQYGKCRQSHFYWQWKSLFPF